VDDDAFLAHVADRLAGLPAVRAVSLGGSRAEGTHRPDSDWDFSVYYRGNFDPQALRDIGRFRIEPLMFHLAGIPSYLVLAELAVKRVLHGELPTPGYPAALRTQASRIWWDRSCRTFDYARQNHARFGRLTQCAGLAAQAASQAAHAVLAGRGEWITNEKQLLTKAGLREVDAFFADARPDPGILRDVVDRTRAACANAMRKTGPLAR
jgi:hypothetical protein